MGTGINDSGRSAGILMHITSLPGKYTTGDLGHNAYAFADFLEKSGQRYWQLLPLNQPDRNCDYSPYSAVSAFAGNILLVSPELLYSEGLIRESSLLKKNRSDAKADFKTAEDFKLQLLDEAYEVFKKKKPARLTHEFQTFCEKEAYWLNDYVVFMTIRKLFEHQPWNLWPEELKTRNITALEEIKEHYKEHIKSKKFHQFIFFRQYHALKEYCKNKNILLYGDVPIYIGYDSADVWAHTELFKLKRNLEMSVVAGVPPDYFNDKGQRWGMPVFNWPVVEKTFYKWWVERIKKNLELYDLIRLDHFRGFSAYWEIKAEEITAKKGKWVKGPGVNLFDTLQYVFPQMPFVAEDLGEIDQPVYDLRDRYNLPGMRVLQFTFGKDTGKSIHSPHNYIMNSVVYTGTHDNNTIRGWFEKELSKKSKKILSHYAGRKVNRKNCSRELIRIAYTSVSQIAITPMQDVLSLGRKARMNVPSVAYGNWTWRMTKKELKRSGYKELRRLTEISGRINIH